MSCRVYKSLRWPRGSLGAPRSIPACAGEPRPQGVTFRGGVPCVGTPEIKARRFILAVRYHSEIGNPGLTRRPKWKSQILSPVEAP